MTKYRIGQVLFGLLGIATVGVLYLDAMGGPPYDDWRNLLACAVLIGVCFWYVFLYRPKL